MNCFTDYINASIDTPSRSGLYATDLAGVTVRLLDDLTKEDHADWEECFEYLYKTAQRNLKIDMQRKLAERFHIDKKLITRETSLYLDDFNTGSDLAGVQIQYWLPKYARVQILSIGVFSEAAYTNAPIYIFKDDENGELLATLSNNIAVGRNTLQVYQEFEENKLFIAYDPSVLSLRQTKNRFYPSDWLTADLCNFPCYWGPSGTVRQINFGGLDVKFVVYCSMEKFICENLPLFQLVLLNRLGVDIMKERITTQLVNVSSVLTKERAEELLKIFNDDYMAALDASTESIKMQEDPICFACKKSVSSKSDLP